MSRLDAVSFISHGVGKGGAPVETSTPKGAEEEKSTKSDKGKNESALKQFTVDLNEKAKNGKVDPLIGRMTEAALPRSGERQNSEVRQFNITGNHVFSEDRLRNEMAAEETLPAPMARYCGPRQRWSRPAS